MTGALVWITPPGTAGTACTGTTRVICAGELDRMCRGNCGGSNAEAPAISGIIVSGGPDMCTGRWSGKTSSASSAFFSRSDSFCCRSCCTTCRACR
eukprot:Skav210542  [mRNA]  locus=scaffold3045:470806:471474:+ [translate_table: standard]